MRRIINLSKLKKMLLALGLLLALAIVFYLLLVFVYSLPTEPMQAQMVETSTVFEQEGIYPRLNKRGNSQLDNFTDAIMLLTASFPECENVWKGAIYAPRYKVSKSDIETSADALVYLYQGGNFEEAKSTNYARYWHGYLVFLKPLLMFLNYGEIRIVMECVQLLLFVSLLLLMTRKNWRLTIPFFTTGIFLNLSTINLSLQFNSVLIITFIFMMFILIVNKESKKIDPYFWALTFMIGGAVTAYFDLLTYPLVSLGLPLTLWIVLNCSDKIVRNIKNTVYLSAFWGMGYGGAWALKWILGGMITKDNIIKQAVEKIVDRTSSKVYDNPIGFMDVIIKQIENSIQRSWAMIVLILCIVWILSVIIKKRVKWNLFISLAIISMFPFIWYFCLKNHSFIHCWFTYRGLAVSLFAMLSYIMLEVFSDIRIPTKQ